MVSLARKAYLIAELSHAPTARGLRRTSDAIGEQLARDRAVGRAPVGAGSVGLQRDGDAEVVAPAALGIAHACAAVRIHLTRIL